MTTSAHNPLALVTTLIVGGIAGGGMVGCDGPALVLDASAFADVAIERHSKRIGQISDGELLDVAAQNGARTVLRVRSGACQEPCQWIAVAIDVMNTQRDTIGNPVLHMQTPTGEPPRTPLATDNGFVAPGQKGHLAALVELYPSENALHARLTRSTVVDIVSTPSVGPVQPPKSGSSAISLTPATSNAQGVTP